MTTIIHSVINITNNIDRLADLPASEIVRMRASVLKRCYGGRFTKSNQATKRYLIEATGARNNLGEDCCAALDALDFAYEYQVSNFPPEFYDKAWANEAARNGVITKVITTTEKLLKVLATPPGYSVRKL